MLKEWGTIFWAFVILMIVFGTGLIIVKLRFKKHYQKYHQK